MKYRVYINSICEDSCSVNINSYGRSFLVRYIRIFHVQYKEAQNNAVQKIVRNVIIASPPCTLVSTKLP